MYFVVGNVSTRCAEAAGDRKGLEMDRIVCRWYSCTSCHHCCCPGALRRCVETPPTHENYVSAATATSARARRWSRARPGAATGRWQNQNRQDPRKCAVSSTAMCGTRSGRRFPSRSRSQCSAPVCTSERRRECGAQPAATFPPRCGRPRNTGTPKRHLP